MHGRHRGPRGRHPYPEPDPYDRYFRDAYRDDYDLPRRRAYGYGPRRRAYDYGPGRLAYGREPWRLTNGHGPGRRADGHGPRRWPRAYDAPEGEPRRRREDREEPREEERGLAERAREVARRYREPLIGLTMAGLAAPLAETARAPEAPEMTEAERLAGIAERRPAEEEVGRWWARAEAEEVREETIEGATVRYGISRDLAADIYDAAVANDIDPDVGYGLVNTESTFDRRAVSNVGARGLTQVMPRTGAWLRPGTTAESLFNPQLNLDLGFGYLRDLIDKYDGDMRLALLAYNRGPGTVDRVLARGGNPDNGYADKVLSG